MAGYITDLDVSLNGSEEQLLQSKGFKKINVDLNKGAGGNSIYLWYKVGSQRPITRVQATFTHDMAKGVTQAGYTKIDKNLNTGAGGDAIYLWYFKGSGEFHIPIVEVDMTTNAKSDVHKVSQGWERVACDLNRRAGGDWIHAWVKRDQPAYICEVTATDSYATDASHFNNGYIRVDEDTNRGAAGGAEVFIWYRQTIDPRRALTDLKVSITEDDDDQTFQQQGYKQVSVNLNRGTNGPPVYLWYKKEDGSNPIKTIILLLQCDSDIVYKYEMAGVTVIKKDLNTGTKGFYEYLCYYQ